MKKFWFFFVCSFLFFSCSLQLDDSKKQNNNSEVLYGTVRVNVPKDSSNKNDSRALYIEEIVKADVVISGHGMNDIVKENVEVSNGQGGFEVSGVPVGKNRVVKIYAKKTIENVTSRIEGTVMYAVTDVVGGNNNVSVSWATTAIGKIYDYLIKNNYDLVSSLSKDTVESYLPNNVHSSLINCEQIAQDIISNSVQNASNYEFNAGSLSFSLNSVSSYNVYLCDPVSSYVNSTSSSVQTINNIAPGTWSFYIVKNNAIIYSDSITIQENQNLDLGQITLKTTTPRLEDANGTQIVPSLNQGEQKVIYLASRKVDGEVIPSDVKIYYTLDGTIPTTTSTVYTTSGITVSAGKTLKAIAVRQGFEDSDIFECTFEAKALGFMHPSSGSFSPVEQSSWATASYKLGSSLDAQGNGTFAVYSKNATKILLEIYDAAYGEEAKYDYWMEKGSDNIWRAKLSSVPNGTLYAFRAWGPNWTFNNSWTRGNSESGFVSDFDSNGNRFNPNKLLFDPYAKEISHDKSNPTALTADYDAGMYGTGAETYKGTARRNFDTGKYASKAVLVEDSTSFGTKPQIAQKDAIIYEAHVRGITNHPSSANLSTILSGIAGFEDVVDIPAAYKGTYKGAGLLAPYLKALGINTIELLPVHESDNDCNPDDAPGGNYWAYMTYGYFAPDRRYSSDKSYGGPTKEFKEMVKAFHDAGIEVYLDVVFNHSGEGGPWYNAQHEKYDNYKTAELTFMRGLDNSTYYSLTSDGGYWETTGCGNNLQCDNSVVRQFILDSLTYWIDEMGVDGYRFDLAPVLGREKSSDGWVYKKTAKTITDIMALGTAKNVEMIAEAWDCQWPGGYQVGNFPNGWGEWNGRYRDAMRNFVNAGNRKSDKGDVNDYINGDYTNFFDQGGPHKSVNFIVAHDGFTLADLCSYAGSGNAKNSTLEWPFGPSDGGNGDNNTLGFGNTASAKRQAARNYIALQMISRGVPMIVWGDEFSRTQNGNNNPYNIDSVATWNNYNMINTSSPHTVSTGGSGTYDNNFGTFGNDSNVNGNFMFMKYMLNLKANEVAFRQDSYDLPYDFKKEDGTSTLTDSDKCVWIRIKGSTTTGGSDYLVFINMYTSEISYTIPTASTGKKWIKIVDTASYAETNFNYWEESSAVTCTGTYGVNPWSVVILKEASTAPVTPTVSSPVISGSSYFEVDTSVEITCSTSGASIYYTLDGTVPSLTNGTLYTSAISVTDTTTVKAIAIKEGYTSSSVVSKVFTKGEAPIVSEKSGVMLQGFNWSSAKRGTGYNTENPSPHWYKWYNVVKNQGTAIGNKFAYMWCPPPSKTDTASSEGYAPTQLNDLNNCYGTETELKAMINAISPTKAIADIVVNHRAGTTSWGDFTNPKWTDDYYSICSDDTGFKDPTSPMYGSTNKGAADTGEGYGAYRDLDHTNQAVQQGIIDWMNNVLKPAGFVGWRYDYVKGFNGEYVGKYNQGSNAEFSVGEYWPSDGYNSSNPSAWGNEIKNWITQTQTGGSRSKAFDFALKGAMNTVFGFNGQAGNGNYLLLADSSNLVISAPSDAVTFVDNHDTGSTQGHWALNSSSIGKAYAFILTHPGYPCVAWQHYFTYAESGSIVDAGQYIGGNTVPGTSKTYRQHIDYLIELRQRIGIEYDDTVITTGTNSSYYVGKITGNNGELVVKIGGGSYSPTGDGYTGNNPIYSGTDFAIWEKGVNGEASSSGGSTGGEGGSGTSGTVTITATTTTSWEWYNNADIFAWVWGGSHLTGEWIKATATSSNITFNVYEDATNFLVVRCKPGSTAPNWDATGNADGKIYNKTNDVTIISGTTSYDVGQFVDP